MIENCKRTNDRSLKMRRGGVFTLQFGKVHMTCLWWREHKEEGDEEKC